jgi:hypothetical protein
MKKILIILVLLFGFQVASGQDFNFPTSADYPILPKKSKNINDFVPKHWEIIARADGDLDGDKNPDCVLITQANYARFLNKNEGFGGNVLDTNPRMLIILFKSDNGQYKIAKQSNTFIVIPDSPIMTEPFTSVKIRNDVLELGFELWYSAGTWWAAEYSYKFKFSNREFQLIGVDKTELWRNTGKKETRSYNFLTGKMNVTTGDIEVEKRSKPIWKTFKLKKMKTFDTFKKPFSWEIEPDYFL